MMKINPIVSQVFFFIDFMVKFQLGRRYLQIKQTATEKGAVCFWFVCLNKPGCVGVSHYLLFFLDYFLSIIKQMFSKKCLFLLVFFASVAIGSETADNPSPFKYQPESAKLLEWLIDQCSISNRMIPIGESNDPIEITLDVGLYKLMGINNREEK